MIQKSASGGLPATNLLVFVNLSSIAGCTYAALFSAWHWPLVGDASLMRYVVFLLRSGRAPYSQILDINLPGSYFLEAAAMRVFGSGATGLRLYDGFLSSVICVCATLLSKAGFQARLCALAGAFLLVLIHLRDGLLQAGQRDYAMLAIVLLAYTLLLRGPFAKTSAGSWLFGLLAGCVVTIKPTMILLILLPLYASLLQHERPRNVAKRFGGVLVAFLLPLACMFSWLQTWRSIPAFLRDMELLRRSHSGLAHKTYVFLLIHSMRPVALLFAFGIALLALRRFRLNHEEKLLIFGAAVGLCSFILQGKGFPYQRYPFLGLSVIAIFGLCADEFGARPLSRALATAALALSCFWWAPSFALTVSRYDRVEPFEDSLARELTILHAGPSDVQCLDTVGGCINVLYDKHLVQSTAYLYDCYAYTGPADAQTAYRRSFLAAIEAARPRYIVLTSDFCLDPQPKSNRIEEWSAMQDYLRESYAKTVSWQSTQSLHWWHQPETPPAFEIFVRK